MILAAIMLSIQFDLDLNPLLSAARRAQGKTVCGISIVRYRFINPPGHEIRYAGDMYVIPEEGQLELIADRRNNTYIVNGIRIRIESGYIDQFGFRTVELARDLSNRNTPLPPVKRRKDIIAPTIPDVPIVPVAPIMPDVSIVTTERLRNRPQ